MRWQLEHEIICVLEKILREMEVEEMVRPFSRGTYVMPSAQEAYEHGQELLKRLREKFNKPLV